MIKRSSFGSDVIDLARIPLAFEPKTCGAQRRKITHSLIRFIPFFLHSAAEMSRRRDNKRLSFSLLFFSSL